MARSMTELISLTSEGWAWPVGPNDAIGVVSAVQADRGTHLVSSVGYVQAED